MFRCRIPLRPLALTAILAVAAPVVPASAAADQSASLGDGVRLKVRAERVESDRGMVRVALFESPESFEKPERAAPTQVQDLPAAPGRVTAVFDGLEPGRRYAVRVLHDENGNGRLDRALGFFVIEGEGVSNAADPRHAAFDEAAFAAPENGAMVITVPLRY
ncbi:MAG: DUF2141 domain-containing protein [Caenispirillum bisanense]|nr:DUF2141 domain-containing protein [Caenispirillum bisanense]